MGVCYGVCCGLRFSVWCSVESAVVCFALWWFVVLCVVDCALFFVLFVCFEGPALLCGLCFALCGVYCVFDGSVCVALRDVFLIARCVSVFVYSSIYAVALV